MASTIGDSEGFEVLGEDVAEVEWRGLFPHAPLEAPTGVALSTQVPRLVSGGVTGAGVGGVDGSRADMIAATTDAPFLLRACLVKRRVASSLGSLASSLALIFAMLADVELFKNPWYSVLADSCCAWKYVFSSISARWRSVRTQSR